MWSKNEHRENKMTTVKVWTVAIGAFPKYSFWWSKKRKKAYWDILDYITGLDGFVGFHPVSSRGTLCVFRSENDAKIGRNLMTVKGIRTGTNICEAYIDDSYLESKEETSDV